MPARKFNDLGDFSFCHLESENAANAHAMAMDMQHDLDRILAALGEEFLQNMDDELHRRVVVVEQQYFVEGRLLGFCTRAGDDTGTGIVAFAIIVAVIPHEVPQSPDAQIEALRRSRLSQNTFLGK